MMDMIIHFVGHPLHYLLMMSNLVFCTFMKEIMLCSISIHMILLIHLMLTLFISPALMAIFSLSMLSP